MKNWNIGNKGYVENSTQTQIYKSHYTAEKSILINNHIGNTYFLKTLQLLHIRKF